jgi:hypothetical protein
MTSMYAPVTRPPEVRADEVREKATRVRSMVGTEDLAGMTDGDSA